MKFEWESFAAGAEAFEKYHEYIPKELMESIERTHVGLKGPVTTPIGGGFSSINVALRKQFELFANFRPIRNLPGVPTRYPGVDLIVIRENTEGLYSRHRARGRARRGGEPEDHHREGLDAHLAVRLRIRAQAASARRSTPSTKPTS